MSRSVRRVAELEEENQRFRLRLKNLESTRCCSKDDTLKLDILDASPFTVWACTSDYKIVLWNKWCEAVYGFTGADALGKSFVDLFVDGPEKKEAMKDCTEIIKTGSPYSNGLAYDNNCHGQRRTMLTNCFRVWDSERLQYLQVEMGLVLKDDDLGEPRDKLHEIREVGVVREKQWETLLKATQVGLLNRIEAAFEKHWNKLAMEEMQWKQYQSELANSVGDYDEQTVRDKLRGLADEKAGLQRRMESLSRDVRAISTDEEMQQVSALVDAFYSDAQSASQSNTP